MSVKSKKICALILLFLLGSSHQNLPAQEIDQRSRKRGERDLTAPMRSVLRKNKSDDKVKQKSLLGSQPEIQPLEAAINPDSYVVGPGDILMINIWSSIERNFKIPVTPQGQLIIPTIGTLEVNGKTLAEVQAMVKAAGAKKYLKTTITANLAYLRKFRVHVTGQVMKPGLYQALAIDRVSDIIAEAEGLTNWASERTVQVRHLDGSVDVADLYKYNKLGILDSNVYLRDGDVVYVPPIHFTNATVRVEGMVTDPGIYQLQENETLQDFLLRVDALNRQADLKVAYIERKTMSNGGTETIPIFPYLSDLSNGRTNLHLQDGDLIMVPQRLEKVYVVGAVSNPGPYAYYPNQQALDYVGFAGSTEKAANLSKITVVRRNSRQRIKGDNVLIEPGDTVIVPPRVEMGIREITAVVVTLTNVLLTMKALDIF